MAAGHKQKKKKSISGRMEGAFRAWKKRPPGVARARRRPLFVFVQGDQARRSAIVAMLDLAIFSWPVARSDQARRSMIIAIPWPPPTHMVSRPKVLSALCSPFSSVVMIRAPVMP